MNTILFILGFLGMLSMPCVILGLFGTLYAIGKSEKHLDFFTKMTIYSLLTCIITFGIIVSYNA